LAFLIAIPLASYAVPLRHNGFIELAIFPMTIDFLLGVAIVLLMKYFPQQWGAPCLIAGLVLFLIAAATTNLQWLLINNGYNRVVIFGIPSFLIILALVNLEMKTSFNIHPLFLQLGDASYSIYLVHLPIVAAFLKLLPKLPIVQPLLLSVACLGLLIGVCALGILIFDKIESPLIRKLNRQASVK
jgi:peptidoglycan/LPS O-acetylase OafA/YrhL